MTWGLFWYIFTVPLAAVFIATSVFALTSVFSRWRYRCARGYHVWHKRRRTPPVYDGCMWLSVLSCECSKCGAKHSESRWGFMREAGALSWICGGDCIETPDSPLEATHSFAMKFAKECE